MCLLQCCWFIYPRFKTTGKVKYVKNIKKWTYFLLPFFFGKKVRCLEEIKSLQLCYTYSNLGRGPISWRFESFKWMIMSSINTVFKQEKYSSLNHFFSSHFFKGRIIIRCTRNPLFYIRHLKYREGIDSQYEFCHFS